MLIFQNGSYENLLANILNIFLVGTYLLVSRQLFTHADQHCQNSCKITKHLIIIFTMIWPHPRRKPFLRNQNEGIFCEWLSQEAAKEEQTFSMASSGVFLLDKNRLRPNYSIDFETERWTQLRLCSDNRIPSCLAHYLQKTISWSRLCF